MARKNGNSQAQTNTNNNYPDTATATINGIVNGLYEGKKYDYVTVDVRHNYDQYYDRFKVAVSKSFEVPDDGESITLNCTIKNYKGDITFKEVNADTQ